VVYNRRGFGTFLDVDWQDDCWYVLAPTDMPAAELRRRAIFFLVLAGWIIFFLIAITLIEDWGHGQLVSHWGFDLDARGHLTARTGTPDAPGMMTTTGVSLVEAILRIVKIILWMVLVIASVRMIMRIIFATILRTSTQT
jgi:hypothetical protein